MGDGRWVMATHEETKIITHHIEKGFTRIAITVKKMRITRVLQEDENHKSMTRCAKYSTRYGRFQERNHQETDGCDLERETDIIEDHHRAK